MDNNPPPTKKTAKFLRVWANSKALRPSSPSPSVLKTCNYMPNIMSLTAA